MTSRQTGRRIAAISAERYRRKNGKRSAARQAAGRREDRPHPRERRQLLQLMICSGIFVLLVAAKLVLPEPMARVNARLSRAMEQNMDVQAVFSAVGRAVSGEGGLNETVDEVYQAVFHPQENGEVVQTAAQITAAQAEGAIRSLREYRQSGALDQMEQVQQTAETAADSKTAEVSSLAYVLYSNQNLPESVSLEQAILDFDYCTPVSGTLSSGFGYRDHPIEGEERFHYGVDLAADTGTKVGCFADGVVTAVGESSSYGKYCMVAHEGGYSTLYAHCSRITASSGSTVLLGEKIAEVGETGFATGPHLHFELQKDGVYLNPIYYVSVL
ncbi:M23 family metallopeptidase [Dysosmobacter sp.]|uniref:M23 family metallopeptidase n=1 Tax=Dysosmobacter sp. TaxID=2591382 RepID=UPI002A9C7C33|nr:M23 family metallopeptidase [Dysosmobacter sp.]MDY5613351.1 M23 family metallopeptidase [Dysosmobacter sp.]